jgi:choline dehydrogenase-like flavoprotein
MSSGNKDDTFDIIIIGGGTAGSVLAARLSPTATLRILVLEAGQNCNSDPRVSTPGLASTLLGDQNYDWGFRTVSEEGLNGRVILQPRGKLWGGSSAINSHALVYPSRGYHDAWGSLVGVGKGWDWEGIGNYYRRFQKLQAPGEKVKRELGIGDYAVEGKGAREHDESEYEEGVQASYPVTLYPMQKAWADAIQDLGYSSSKNPVEGDVLGGSTTTNAIDSSRGERSHAGVAFLEPSTKRDNLVVRSNVLVNKIIFGEAKRDGKLVALGVLYSQADGRVVTVHANREVVVCAGTFGSPKVLELSGIGQRERVTAAGIKCLRELDGVGGKNDCWIT